MAASKKDNFKFCNKCKKLLALTDFYRDGSDKKGPRYRNECKKCYKEIRSAKSLAKSLKEVERTTPVIHIGGPEDK